MGWGRHGGGGERLRWGSHQPLAGLCCGVGTRDGDVAQPGGGSWPPSASPQCCQLMAAKAQPPAPLRASRLCFGQGIACMTQHCCPTAAGLILHPSKPIAKLQRLQQVGLPGCSPPLSSLFPVFNLQCRVPARATVGSREQRALCWGSARLRGWCTAPKPAPVSHPSIPPWEPGASQHSPREEAVALQAQTPLS